MKQLQLLFSLILFFIMFQNTFAFDGQREGLTFGVGIGAAHLTNTSSTVSERKLSPLLSFQVSYAFNNNFQLGLGKKSILSTYSGKDFYSEIGGIVVDYFIDNYYLTLGANVAGSANKISVQPDSVLIGKGSFIGLGYKLEDHMYLEFVLANAKYDTSATSIVSPEKENIFGVLLVFHFF